MAGIRLERDDLLHIGNLLLRWARGTDMRIPGHEQQADRDVELGRLIYKEVVSGGDKWTITEIKEGETTHGELSSDNGRDLQREDDHGTVSQG